MQPSTHPPQAETDEPPPAPATPSGPGPEPRGCLFALSQPPLILFLAVIGALLAFCGVHDLLLL